MGLVDLKSNLGKLRVIPAGPTPEDSIDPDPVIINPLKSNIHRPYVNTIVDSEKTPSPIEILHNNESSLTNKFPLAEYYAQAKGSGRLGYFYNTSYRNNNTPGFDQPFVVRDIGDRWGTFDSFSLGNTKFGNNIESIIKLGGSFIDDIGGAVLGRDPSDYIGNTLGAYERTAKFLITPQGIGFLAKQTLLKRRNKNSEIAEVRYGITKDISKIFQNNKKYNPLSLASLPGVTKININGIDPTLPFDEYTDTIADMISQQVYDLATRVQGTLVRTLTGVASNIGGRIKSKFGGTKLGEGIARTTKKLKENTVAIKKKVDAFNEVMTQQDGELSKLTGIKIDPIAFSDVGKDRVNLIPYGSDEHKDKSYKELDFVPFKFYNVNTDKSIVFRAILSGITDTFTPEYSSERYIGRPDNVYVYTGTTREISFTFDIYPKSDEELLTLWEKMNYLAGLTYPSWEGAAGGGAGMVAPFCKLTLGQMYDNTSGYISGLTYTVMDSSTWETTFAKLPKYIQASCTFVYIGDRLPSSTQKHYELPWVQDEEYKTALIGGNGVEGLLGVDPNKLVDETLDNILGKVGL